MPKLNQKGIIHFILPIILVAGFILGFFLLKNPQVLKGEMSAQASNGYFVKPYLVYPSDKPIYPEYETAVNKYLVELQDWYGKVVGVTFELAPLKVVKSTQNYQTMRCGVNPTVACLNNPAKLEGNLGKFVNEAIHGGQEKWDVQTAALVFAAGAGGYAGGSKISSDAGWAIVGDWVLEPISGKANTWGIPCKYSDGWQCSGNTPKGSPAHELGHAFGLDHPPAGSPSIMASHGLYPTTGFLPSEIQQLKASPFFIKTQGLLGTILGFFPPVVLPTSPPIVTSCPKGTVREECIGYSSNRINAYCWGTNNSYLGGKCSSSCAEASKCGVITSTPAPTPVPTPVPTSVPAPISVSVKNEKCDESQRKECIGYSSNGINAYCWKGPTYMKGVCNKDCSSWEGCR